MFTSRAEYRLMLRQDNADIRLTEKSNKIGLASSERLSNVTEKIINTEEIIKYFKTTSVNPEDINALLLSKETSTIKQNYKLFQILSRPQIGIIDFIANSENIKSQLSSFDSDSILQAEILMKYEGYLEKEQLLVEKMNRLENIRIGDNFDFKIVKSLSLEAREKLIKQRPKTLGQAARISGIAPSDISILMVHLGR
jgi:tRNA uridine 5-carboxymethylaminomethyl modification enzyme